MDRNEIIRVLRAFEERRLEYVLIGASAMAFHGLVRATEDLDLFIRATPENIERLRQALKDAYADDPQIDEISSADLLGEYPAIRYYPPTGDLYLDVLTRLGESARFETVEAEIREIEGTHVRIATPAALYRMKRGTIREKDPDKRVQKFRSIEEMNKAEIRRGDFESFLRHCARWWAIAPRQYPRGVFKFRTIEEAQDARRKHST
ncbi:MAG: hypothetical protein V7638_2218 [Acidobacteriota bacterium]